MDANQVRGFLDFIIFISIFWHGNLINTHTPTAALGSVCRSLSSIITCCTRHCNINYCKLLYSLIKYLCYFHILSTVFHISHGQVCFRNPSFLASNLTLPWQLDY